MNNGFVHLHVHSEYSLINSIVRVETLIPEAVKTNMPAIALTDHVNLFAAVKFYQEAIAAGIKPIIGADMLLDNESSATTPYRFTLLCQDQTGYHNLTKLISQAYVSGQTTGEPIIKREWLKDANEGLIVLSGGKRSDIGHALLLENETLATEYIRFWQEYFPNRYYIELIRTGRSQEEVYIQHALKFAAIHQLPVVATNDVCFIAQEDYEAHEARVCIQQSTTLEDERRPRDYNEQQYLRSQEEMIALFRDIPEALANSVMIAKRCNLQLQLGKAFLPRFPIPDKTTVEEYLTTQAQIGLEERLQKTHDPNASDYATQRELYEQRLALELQVINSMGFAGYFLIVADFIQWANENGVPVGPGRGSGAGSLVAYALKITGLDPIAHDLLFERFLNPERISMPDFDIDFCMDGRDRVIEYVFNRYGHESVAQIITFGTMAAKAVVRDVGRVLAHPYGFVDKIAKLIPFELGMTLEKALEQEEQLRERYEQEEEVKSLIDLALKLEGVVRNAGKHAGGVVISPSKITDFTPLYCEAGGEHIVTQFDKDDVEAVGLVKFDFLGLRTLTIIDWTLKTINENQPDNIIDIEQIPMADKAAFDLLKACQTTGVFQLESRGMKDLIKRLQPDCFDDIVALVALFRPGPLQSGMVDDFINRKHGQATIEYPHPDLEPILRATYGVILYQEQVMQIAQVLAGYTLGGADILRRAMGKKKPEEMAKQRAIFTDGAIARGVPKQTAQLIFDLMEKFAGYGFNKSHSAAYALVSYQTAWLKANYASAFMAAVLSSDMDHTDKVVNLIDECRVMKITVLAPDVNQGYYKFTVADDKTIIYGLGALKGVGEAAIELIIQEREKQGKYADLFDFCRRLDLRKVNRRVLEALIKAGGLDGFGVDRAILMASLDVAIKLSEAAAKNSASGQNDLFSMQENPTLQAKTADYIFAKPWTEEERLAGEKEILGLYLSGHPVDRYKEEFQHFLTGPIASLTLNRNQSFLIAGIIVATRIMFTKRGDRMAFITLDDSSARLELAIFSDLYSQIQDLLVKDELVIVAAEGGFDEYSGKYKVSVKNMLSIADARTLYGNYLLLSLSSESVTSNFLAELKQRLAPFKSGKTPLCIAYDNKQARSVIELGPEWHVYPADQLIAALNDLCGQVSVKMVYE